MYIYIYIWTSNIPRIMDIRPFIWGPKAIVLETLKVQVHAWHGSATELLVACGAPAACHVNFFGVDV